MNARKSSSLALAAAAAVLFTSAAFNVAAAEEGKVKCEGVNACKGTGFLELTRAQCEAAKAKTGDSKQTPT